MPVFYARPEVVGTTVRVEPALASWDKAGPPGQARSAAFIADVHSAVAEQLRATPDPLALRLDIGLPAAVPLLAINDLDNYLFRSSRSSPRPLGGRSPPYGRPVGHGPRTSTMSGSS